MKLIDVIDRIDKSPQNECYINLDDIAEQEFNLCLREIPEQDRLKAYWISKLYDTSGEYVGNKIYFLDDEPICFSTQKYSGRDEVFQWFSEESLSKLGEYIFYLTMKEREYTIRTIDDIELGNGYKLKYTSEIPPDSKALLNGEAVTIVDKMITSRYKVNSNLKIRLANGDEQIVHISELDFQYNTID